MHSSTLYAHWLKSNHKMHYVLILKRLSIAHTVARMGTTFSLLLPARTFAGDSLS